MIRRGMQPHKTKIATIRYTNDCDFTSYSKRDLNPHSRNGQGILSPSPNSTIRASLYSVIMQ